MKLEQYNKKRDFSNTKEPEGKIETSKSEFPIFVIQKHNATRLHYDFRIEVEGVLKSWAVPKGLSTDTKERHLAMMVEDHPYSYKDFEGVIPEGNYGAGEVIVWDTGTYTVEGATTKKEVDQKVLEGIKSGDIKLILNGQKAKGRYAFVRFKRAGDNAWLLLKEKDDYVGSNLLDDERSVLTEKTLEDIKQSNDSREWTSTVIKPMLAELIDKPFNDKEWLFEEKLDGYRAIADISNGNVRLYSRNNITLNSKYPKIIDELEKLGLNIILDGEIVVEDQNGIPSFQALQNYNDSRAGNLIYYVFDILKLNDLDLTKLPLIERKNTLKKLIKNNSVVKKTNYILEEGITAFTKAKERLLEGIVAKKINSEYIQERSSYWKKIKAVHEQEVVIGGYTFPEGLREGFGALLVGMYQNNKFIYVGRTGSGFSSDLINELKTKFDKHILKNSPFDNFKDDKNVAAWISPKFVAQIKFAEWTESGNLRQAIFLGLRDDKDPKDVHKEI
mgnify:FL=1